MLLPVSLPIVPSGGKCSGVFGYLLFLIVVPLATNSCCTCGATVLYRPPPLSPSPSSLSLFTLHFLSLYFPSFISLCLPLFSFLVTSFSLHRLTDFSVSQQLQACCITRHHQVRSRFGLFSQLTNEFFAFLVLSVVFFFFFCTLPVLSLSSSLLISSFKCLHLTKHGVDLPRFARTSLIVLRMSRRSGVMTRSLLRRLGVKVGVITACGLS